MKRKRGGNKGKAKKQKVADVKEIKAAGVEVVDTVDVDDSAGEEEVVEEVNEGKNGESKSAMEVETSPAPAAVEQIEKKDENVVAAVVPEKPAERKVQVVYGRVRVKLKSKPLESAPSSSGGAALVEVDKIAGKNGKEEDKIGKHEEEKSVRETKSEKEQVATKEKEDVSKKVVEDMDSSPDIMLSALGNVPKKGGSLKVKSLKGAGGGGNVASKDTRVVEEPPKALREQKVEKKDVKNDKQEQRVERKNSKDGKTEQKVEKKDPKTDKQEKMVEKNDAKESKPEQRVEKKYLKTDKLEHKVEKKDLKDGKKEERLEKNVPNYDQLEQKVEQTDSKLKKQEQMMEEKDMIYDKQELETALEVIGKVMKMDAAEPFNVPVDPVALGIPDYFDVIDTPMDFGTISSNIQSGAKYKNSEDVFKDVQYIWDNCFKYNNKGDYVVDLMKRVKKNFTKYWQAAGLYSDQVRKSGGADGSLVDDGSHSGQGKNQVKSGSSKTKMKKKSALKRHKDGCLCAICVLKRRRIEKEGKDVEELTGISDSSMTLDMKLEGNSIVESPVGGDASSVPGSQDQDSDADMEEKVDEPGSGSIDLQPIGYTGKKDEESVEMKEKNENDSHYVNGSGESNLPYLQSQEVVELAPMTPADAQKDTHVQLEEDPEIIQQRKLQEAEAKQKRIKMIVESYENPMLLELCSSLFPEDSKSIWHGPHSIIRKQRRAPMSSIHSAIESLLK